MKHIKILLILLLSLLWSAGAHAYWWDYEDDWWNNDPYHNFDLPDVDVYPPDKDDWWNNSSGGGSDTGSWDNWGDDSWNDNWGDPWDSGGGGYSYNDDDDEWDPWQGDDSNNNNNNNNNNNDKDKDQNKPDDDKDSDKKEDDPLSHEEMEKKVKDIVKELLAALGLKEFPREVVFLKDGTYEGLFQARVANGRIEVSSMIFYNSDHGRQVSIIYHEYIHVTQDKPVANMKDGFVDGIKTGEPCQYTDWQIERQLAIVTDFCETFNANTPEGISDCIKNTMDLFYKEEYEYLPSNFYWNEVNAYEKQIEGADLGYYSITDEYRKELEESVEHFRNKATQAEEYENRKGYKSDGSKK